MGKGQLVVSSARCPKYSVVLLTMLVVFCEMAELAVLPSSSSQLLRIGSHVFGCCDSNPDTSTVKNHKNFLIMYREQTLCSFYNVY